MGLLVLIHRWITQLNSVLLFTGRHLAWICVALMTSIILLQVFFRYILNDALPWTEEAARALMIWMTAFAAPTAYRYGGFVAIDLLHGKLKPIIRFLLSLILLLLAGLVLFKLFDLALQYFERGFSTYTASIRLPWDTTEKLKRAWIYLALPVCFGGMLLVNIELILREIGRYFGQESDFPEPSKPTALTEQEA